jgi:hypothetical protein
MSEGRSEDFKSILRTLLLVTRYLKLFEIIPHKLHRGFRFSYNLWKFLEKLQLLLKIPAFVETVLVFRFKVCSLGKRNGINY